MGEKDETIRLTMTAHEVECLVALYNSIAVGEVEGNTDTAQKIVAAVCPVAGHLKTHIKLQMALLRSQL